MFLACLQFEKKLEDQVLHLFGPGVRTIDLVYENDRVQAGRQGLLQDKTGLGLRPLVGIHHKHYPVHHLHYPFDLASEIGMPRGIHYVDQMISPFDGGVLGLDRYSTLPLLIHGVHGPLLDHLVFPEGSGVFEQLVDQGGFPVIDVGDDGQVPYFVRLDDG